MLHDIWVQWTVSPCYQDLLTHHLFAMQLSCGMGHRMVALVRVIKYARHIHLHHILHYFQWSSTWLIFSWYWHLRLMWYALSWLHDIPEPTLLFYLVVSCSCNLVIMLYDSYSSRTSHVHYIHVRPCMHGRLAQNPLSRFSCYCYYNQFSIMLIILFLLFQCPTRVVTILFSYSFFTVLSFVYSCWFASDGTLLFFSI